LCMCPGYGVGYLCLTAAHRFCTCAGLLGWVNLVKGGQSQRRITECAHVHARGLVIFALQQLTGSAHVQAIGLVVSG
jgi:hypothetical protein